MNYDDTATTYPREVVLATLSERLQRIGLQPWLYTAEDYLLFRSVLELIDPPQPEPRVLPEVDGLLTCPSCGGHEFKENGSHHCDWAFNEQDAEGKALVLDGSFDWYDGEFVSYECLGCGGQFDQLAEGWDTEYS